MKITEKYNLNKSQAELDFVNIDIATDTPLFLDPYFISIRQDPWSIQATNTIRRFFQLVVELIRANRIDEAKEYFQHLNEPNETCLGLSKNKPQGRGVGSENAEDIFESMIESKAVQMGVVNNLEDCALFVEGIGKDKISDMVTNILKKQLIEYTYSQCKLWEIPLTSGIQSGFFWDPVNLVWDNINCDMLVADDKKILLVPKSIVSYSEAYTEQKFHQHFILNFLQQENLEQHTSLVRARYNKKGEIIKEWVAKKDVKEQQAPLSKEFLRTFSRSHPQVLELFKQHSQKFIKTVNDGELESFNESDLVDYLTETLQSIPAGNEHADNYNKLIAGILEFIFHPQLTCPDVERKDHNGRKRIDIVFNNAASSGFFKRLHEIHKVTCPYIVVECKNYSSDPANPELDQLSGRFGPNKGTFGFLVCRKIENQTLFMQRCSDTNKDERGKIIPLTDTDIIAMLNNIKSKNRKETENLLDSKFKDLNFG